jgi:hypothetical protein
MVITRVSTIVMGAAMLLACAAGPLIIGAAGSALAVGTLGLAGGALAIALPCASPRRSVCGPGAPPAPRTTATNPRPRKEGPRWPHDGGT